MKDPPVAASTFVLVDADGAELRCYGDALEGAVADARARPGSFVGRLPDVVAMTQPEDLRAIARWRRGRADPNPARPEPAEVPDAPRLAPVRTKPRAKPRTPKPEAVARNKSPRSARSFERKVAPQRIPEWGLSLDEARRVLERAAAGDALAIATCMAALTRRRTGPKSALDRNGLQKALDLRARGRSMTSIAKELGCSTSAISRHLARAEAVAGR